MRRWRTGTKPDPGHLVALLNLTIELGLLHHLLPTVGELEAAPCPACAERVGQDQVGASSRVRSRFAVRPTLLGWELAAASPETYTSVM